MMCDRIRQRRSMIIPIVCVVFSFLAAGVAVAQPPSDPQPDEGPSDTTSADTTSPVLTPSDSLDAMLDSVMAAAPGPGIRPFDPTVAPLGSLTNRIAEPGHHLITDRDLVWHRYFTAFDVLRSSMPAYPASQGSPGLVRTFSYAGASPGAISTLFNGRPLFAHAGIGYDIENYPIEFIERVEITRGARAAIYGTGESLIALNFVQPEFDVDGSYLRAEYSQGAYDLKSGDLMYSRNFSSRANLSIGVRGIGSSGLFNNQQVANIDLRSSVRWNIPGGAELSFTHFYTDVTRGLNGGLTLGSSLNPQGESVVFNNLEERQLRHDVTLATRWMPEHDSTADERGLFRLDLAGYYSNVLRRLSDADSVALHLGTAGIRSGLVVPLGGLRIVANALAEVRHFVTDSTESRYEPFVAQGGVLAELPLGALLLRGGGRVDASDRESLRTIAIGEAVVGLDSAFSISATGRYFIDNNASGIDSLALFSSVPTTFLGEAAVDYSADDVHFRLDGFYRMVDTAAALVDSNGQSFAGDIYGGSLNLTLPVASLITLENQLIATVTPGNDHRFPMIFGRHSAWMSGTSFDDNLDWRVGALIEWQSNFKGAEYEVRSGDLRYGINQPFEPVLLRPNLEVFAQGRIGYGFIRISMQNLLGNEFWTLVRYPIPTRMVVIQAVLSLFD